jgi:glycosyltransferase involved in cell wall biosynthesis
MGTLNSGVMSEQVTVVIPTHAHPDRTALLDRAIASVLEQDGCGAVPLLVLNGVNDDRLLSVFCRDAQMVRLPVASLPLALYAGRRAVETPYFSVLDDDDFFLPNAIETRISLLRNHPERDAVITNGFVREGGTDKLFAPKMASFNENPLAALVERNWLSPGSALFRTNRIGEDVFRGIPRYLEWTYIGIRLSMNHRLLFSDEPTFVYNKGTPQSISSSDAYVRGQPEALSRILELELPDELRTTFRRHRTMALHEIAMLDLRRGNFFGAWRAHLASLSRLGGWRFLPFTRKLLGIP